MKWRTPSQGQRVERQGMGWSHVLMGFIYNHYLRDFEQARVNYEKPPPSSEKEVGDQTDIANPSSCPGQSKYPPGRLRRGYCISPAGAEAFPFRRGNSRASLLSDLSLYLPVCRAKRAIPSRVPGKFWAFQVSAFQPYFAFQP